ncbi:MAG: hypothetical protein JXQ26_09605 [Tissierellales bacterium]|jgi:fluoroacetyl-CoA thioesterase|nr:hypothetical protein [Tissierellales bacterium]MBN2828236.1 hypothetical protein [Tissierellales bacterium]
MINHNIEEGMVMDYRKITNASDTSESPGSIELYYLVSTTSIINSIIDASSQMLDQLLPSDYITIGTRIELSHEKPTLVGETINLRIKVVRVENAKVFLEFEGTDPVGVFCRGKYERHIVNKGRLMESAYRRFPATHKMP